MKRIGSELGYVISQPSQRDCFSFLHTYYLVPFLSSFLFSLPLFGSFLLTIPSISPSSWSLFRWLHVEERPKSMISNEVQTYTGLVFPGFPSLVFCKTAESFPEQKEQPGRGK
jgi:hypothetical protein